MGKKMVGMKVEQMVDWRKMLLVPVMEEQMVLKLVLIEAVLKD